METHQEFIQSKLRDYLDSASLSLSQVAIKLEISKGHLSEIKNGKKSPNLDLGLRILKQCGTSLDERRQWTEAKNFAESSEYEELRNSISESANKIKLSEEISLKLATDMSLMNIYLDIGEAGEQGLSKDYIKRFYGLDGINKCEVLKSYKMITESYGSYFSSNERLVMTKEASYQLLKTMTEDQHRKFQQNQLDGKFQFQITDISSEGAELVKQKLEETMQEISTILKEHKLSTHQGGKRIFTQTMMGAIKNSLQMLILCFVLTSPVIAGDGGIEGGSSMTIGGFQTEIEALRRGFELERELNEDIRQTRLERDVLKKHCTKLVEFNALADIQVKNVQVEPYWKNQEKMFELKVNLKVDCIGKSRFKSN